jgi:hypothetical protein
MADVEFVEPSNESLRNDIPAEANRPTDEQVREAVLDLSNILEISADATTQVGETAENAAEAAANAAIQAAADASKVTMKAVETGVKAAANLGKAIVGDKDQFNFSHIEFTDDYKLRNKELLVGFGIILKKNDPTVIKYLEKEMTPFIKDVYLKFKYLLPPPKTMSGRKVKEIHNKLDKLIRGEEEDEEEEEEDEEEKQEEKEEDLTNVILGEEESPKDEEEKPKPNRKLRGHKKI